MGLLTGNFPFVHAGLVFLTRLSPLQSSPVRAKTDQTGPAAARVGSDTLWHVLAASRDSKEEYCRYMRIHALPSQCGPQPAQDKLSLSISFTSTGFAHMKQDCLPRRSWSLPASLIALTATFHSFAGLLLPTCAAVLVTGSGIRMRIRR